MTKPYKKGQKAKELLNIYKNPYIKGSWEYGQWEKGFRDGVYEPINFNVELEDCSSFIDDCEPLYVEPRIIK